jgi:hypothetical protein
MERKFGNVKVGDTVYRWLAGELLLPLNATAVTADLIICGGTDKDHGGWSFDVVTGAEIDEELDWGPPPKSTGSFITLRTCYISTCGRTDAHWRVQAQHNATGTHGVASGYLPEFTEQDRHDFI